MEKGPFSLYDFMGYFIPGALALYLIFIDVNSNLTEFSEKFFIKDQNKFIEMPLYIIVFYIILAYCFGHFLSFFSTLTVEKYTRIFYGDPSKNLLSANERMRNKIVLRNVPLKKIIKKILENITLIFILPLVILDSSMYFLRYKHRYLKQIPKPYRELVLEKIKTVFSSIGYVGDVCNIEENNYHQFLIHYNYEYTKVHGSKLMNYVSLYGFLRVITLISSIYLCHITTYFLINYCFDLSVAGLKQALLIFCTIFSYALLTFIFYLGYLKFYKRYTLENLMLILIVEKV